MTADTHLGPFFSRRWLRYRPPGNADSWITGAMLAVATILIAVAVLVPGHGRRKPVEHPPPSPRLINRTGSDIIRYRMTLPPAGTYEQNRIDPKASQPVTRASAR